MIDDGGGAIKAIQSLIPTADIQKGFKVLRDSGQMNSAFEVLLTRHQDKLSPAAVASARWRLDNTHNLT